jgi:hypothetical protein
MLFLLLLLATTLKANFQLSIRGDVLALHDMPGPGILFRIKGFLLEVNRSEDQSWVVFDTALNSCILSIM